MHTQARLDAASFVLHGYRLDHLLREGDDTSDDPARSMDHGSPGRGTAQKAVGSIDVRPSHVLP
jgi:hypothetical protein